MLHSGMGWSFSFWLNVSVCVVTFWLWVIAPVTIRPEALFFVLPYTIEMFQKRNASLSKEIARLQETEEKLLRKRESGEQANQAALDIIPTTQHILDNYDALTTDEKNRLWKLVLRKVTAYRTPDGELSVHIYPKLPKAI